MLFMQPIPWACAFDLPSAGSSKAARLAMMAITTSISMSVNPVFFIKVSARESGLNQGGASKLILQLSTLELRAEKRNIRTMKTTRPLPRRSFLKSAAIATTAAPFLLPSRIWSAETKPNDRIALGFIGMGTQNRGLLGGFLTHKQTQVLAVCDVDTTRRENAKKIVEDYYANKNPAGAYKGCATHHDFRELIGRKDIDAVVIATPDHWHAFIAITAANAGKDIYCEKPLCESIRESQAMIRAVRKNNVVFQTGSMQRSSREFRTACELVRNGVIGKIRTVEVAVGGPAVPCNLPTEAEEPGLDWDMWLGPAPQRGYNSELSPRGVHKHFPNWRNYREYGGGG